MLNLGPVGESAEVFINGNKLATLIGPVFSCIINSSDFKTDNTIKIKVSNSMANRIIDMDKRQVAWKKFNNTNFPAKLAENRGEDKLFNASKWQPRTSGLSGPVTLTAVE